MNIKDESGYVVFSDGDIGSAHVMAHRLLDAGDIETGRKHLGEWLAGRRGTGSEWAHIQFHMAVFELEAGDWNAAHARFLDQVLPIAAATDHALTDAPALAWRLALRADSFGDRDMAWTLLRRTALKALERDKEPFVELHNLLALAGAGDSVSLDRWLRRRRGTSACPSPLVQMGKALCDVTLRRFQRAADRLREVVPEIPAIGGSRAQNALFAELRIRMAA